MSVLKVSAHIFRWCQAFNTSSVLLPDVNSCIGRDNGPYPHPDDCSKYIQCWNGLGTEMTCQGFRQAFNGLWCDDLDKVPCAQEATTSAPVITPGEPSNVKINLCFYHQSHSVINVMYIFLHLKVKYYIQTCLKIPPLLRDHPF